MKKGFTLLETIIAIAILSLAMLGPLELASRTIGVSIVSQNQITAFYLAQEGIEYVRNERDNNFINGNSWLSGLNQCWSSNGCYVDIPNNSVGNISSYNDCPDKAMKYDNTANNYYNYGIGECTIFSRTVKITRSVGGNDDEANIEVVVSWREKHGVKSVVLEENIFNWLP